MVPRDPHRDQPVLAGGAPLSEAAGALVLLHGRGGSAQDMLTLARELDRPSFAWFAPEAAGRAWYPFSLLEPLERNRAHLSSAVGLVKRLLGRIEEAGLAAERVVLFGFSQGAGVVLEFAVRYPRRYGGIVAAAGGLLGPEGTPRDYSGSLAGTPVFLGLGDRDPHVPKRRVTETAAVLERMGAIVTQRVYSEVGHTLIPDELAALAAALDQVSQTAGPGSPT
jgi:predicted esterase